MGIALSARATQQLRDAHIRGEDLRTVASFHVWADRGGRIPTGAVVVVDEAGVVGTRDLVAVQEAVLAAEGRLVFVGDTEQLTEIDAGGYFRSLHRRLGEQVPDYRRGHELHTVIRQKDPRDIEALKALRLGDAAAAVKNLDDRGLVFEGADAREAARKMVSDWLVARDAGKDVLMLARQRATVHDLNALAQAVREQRGELGDLSVAIAGGQRIHPGDAVLFRRSNQELGLINGTRGEVRAINDDGSALIAVDGDRGVVVGSDWLNGVGRDGTEFVQLGYAGTGHVYQGATAAVALALVSDDVDRQWAYTVLSRHRDEVRMYAVAEPSWVARSENGMGGGIALSEPEERLAGVSRAMSRDRSKQTALEVLESEPAGPTRSPREERVAELIVKRREAGHLSMKELTELQRLQRLLRQSEGTRRDAGRTTARQMDEERRRGPERDRGRQR